jgi:hypothetical protein
MVLPQPGSFATHQSTLLIRYANGLFLPELPDEFPVGVAYLAYIPIVGSAHCSSLGVVAWPAGGFGFWLEVLVPLVRVTRVNLVSSSCFGSTTALSP